MKMKVNLIDRFTKARSDVNDTQAKPQLSLNFKSSNKTNISKLLNRKTTVN